MSNKLSDGLWRAVTEALEETEYERHDKRLDAVMAVIEAHTERVEINELANNYFTLEVWHSDRWNTMPADEMIGLTMLKGSGSWENARMNWIYRMYAITFISIAFLISILWLLDDT